MWRMAVVGWFCASVGVLAGTATAAPVVVPGFDVRDVVTGLSQPTALAWAPGKLLFIAEKGGALRLWTRRSGLRQTPVIRIPTCEDSEMGLLGIAVDPDFATNGYLYLYHTQPPAGDPSRCGTSTGRTNRIVRVTVTDETAGDLTVLLDGIRTDNGNHDGGGLHFGTDGFLYVGVGDTGVGDAGDPGEAVNPYAQDRQSLNGKILRLTRTGEPAPGNPFAGEGGAAEYVYAYGFRNPFRFAIEAATGLLWVADVGQVTWEEIDVVRAGDNLGWPQCEGFQPSNVCPGDSVSPIYVYNHNGDSASITGGVFYDQTRFGEAYTGNYFYGDYELDRIWRAVPTHDPEGFAGPPELFVDNAGGPVDFAVGSDGSLYYVAIAASAVRRVVPKAGTSLDCARVLGQRTSAWAQHADAAIRRCLGAKRDECLPPSRFSPRVPAPLASLVNRTCGAAPPPELCTRLACDPCVVPDDLTRCMADRVTDFATTTYAEALDGDDGRCARTLARATMRGAVRRLAAYQQCRDRKTDSCTPPSLGPGLARKIARACNDPGDALCDTLGCSPPCGNGSAFASCASDWVGVRVDELAVALDGVD